ncbi:hypothetical protein QNH10_01015 [Sporosarcina thermotolerans]|nr:hypothetical protein [Sporosarcina thermotolerans]WHT48454.1 hypothetical protein QNH10_01015 [Sporosarcina thermotolerans]
MLVLILSVFFGDYRPQNVLIIGVAFAFSAFFYIGMGTLLGLFAKSVMEANVIVLPVLLFFSMGTFALPFAEKYPVLKVLEYFPNVQLIEIAAKVEAGGGFGDTFLPLGIILAWAIAMFGLTVVVYRKRMVD